MARRAFATLVTDDTDGFLSAAQVCVASTFAHLSAATASDVPFLVLVTANVSRSSRAQLTRLDARVRVVDVEPIATPTLLTGAASAAAAARELPPGWQGAGYTKLRIWSLTDFDLVVYLDADVLVMEDISELLSRPGSPCPTAAPDVFPPDKFNAGVMVLRPDAAVFARMMDAIATLPSHDGGDTGFLNAFFPSWYAQDASYRLPFAYNAQRTLHWLTHDKAPGYWDVCKPIKILHFSSSPKPWSAAARGRKGELELLWWRAYLTHVQRLPDVATSM